jgi:hypothetical protein
MKKVFLFFGFLAILFTAFKTNVYALGDACTDAEKIRLRELVAATKVTYEYYEESNPYVGGTFHGYRVSISNFKPDFYVYDEKRGSYFATSESIAIDSKFVGGITYDLPFYASKGTACDGYLIMTKYIKMPYYNQYWDDPLCKGHEDYILCKKFTSLVIDSKEEFEQRMNAYIRSLKKKEPEMPIVTPIKEKSTFENAISFLSDNYMYFLVSIIVIGTVSIVIIEVRKKRGIL